MDDPTQNKCVLMLNLPPKALGGIDLISFTATPRFHGIKNLPPGWHFVFAASDTSLSIRHGAWFNVSDQSNAPQIFVKKWDPAVEDLVAEQSEAEVMRWRANLGTIWVEGLFPYRQTATDPSGKAQEESTDWPRLTSHITPALLSRITGSTSDHWNMTSASSAGQDVDDIPGLSRDEATATSEKELKFLPIDLKRTWREGATGRERTKDAQDRSSALTYLIEKYCTPNKDQSPEMAVLGELQFSFLMILTLNNNSCLEQWKRIIQLLFTCREAPKWRTKLYIETLRTLKLQFSHCNDAEGGLFDLSDDGGFLKPLLRKFRKGLNGEAGEWKQDVIDELDDLQDYFKEAFGWEFNDSFVKHGILELEDGERVEMDVGGLDEEDETGEYAPTVVDLTPSQIRELESGRPGDHIDSTMNDEQEAELDEMDARY